VGKLSLRLPIKVTPRADPALRPGKGPGSGGAGRFRLGSCETGDSQKSLLTQWTAWAVFLPLGREIDGISGRNLAMASAGLTRMRGRALTQMGRGFSREPGSAPDDWRRCALGRFSAGYTDPSPDLALAADQDLSRKSALTGAGVDSDVDSDVDSNEPVMLSTCSGPFTVCHAAWSTVPGSAAARVRGGRERA
jgi:hypothetical protein